MGDKDCGMGDFVLAACGFLVGFGVTLWALDVALST